MYCGFCRDSTGLRVRHLCVQAGPWLTLMLQSLPEYGWNDTYSSGKYINDVKYMSSHVLCWPRVPELLKTGHKFNLIDKLDRIAQVVTKTKWPTSHLLGTEDNPPRGWIVKREHSDIARHVIIPKTARSVVSVN